MDARGRPLVVSLIAVGLAGCRGMTSTKPPVHLNPSMDNQPKARAQSESDFFYDGASMRPPVPGTVARGELRAVGAVTGSAGLRVRVATDLGYRLDGERQLTLGADVGLRGWSPDFFDGTGRALANVQWRALIKDDVFHVLALGFEVFADAGATWDARVGRGTDGVRVDAGFGIIGDLTTIGLVNIARIELGFPDDGSGPTVIVSTSALF